MLEFIRSLFKQEISDHNFRIAIVILGNLWILSLGATSIFAGVPILIMIVWIIKIQVKSKNLRQDIVFKTLIFILTAHVSFFLAKWDFPVPKFAGKLDVYGPVAGFSYLAVLYQAIKLMRFRISQ